MFVLPSQRCQVELKSNTLWHKNDNTYQAEACCDQECDKVQNGEVAQPIECLTEFVQHSEPEHEGLPDEGEVPERQAQLESQLDAREYIDSQYHRQVGIVLRIL